jgi:hypothetical protein
MPRGNTRRIEMFSRPGAGSGESVISAPLASYLEPREMMRACN